MTVNAFLLDQIQALGRVCRIYLIVNADESHSLTWQGADVTLIPVTLKRKISPWRDLTALICLYRLFRQYKFDIVHSVTPKAGLLAMMSAFLVGNKTRIHTFTGQIWATRSGFPRWLLKSIDRLIALLATHVLVDSASQREFLISEGVVNARKAEVLANGSISGVDTRRFRRNIRVRNQIRDRLGISTSAIVFLFVGRLTKDKGILDLVKAFYGLCDIRKDVHCVIVGPDEMGLRNQVRQLSGVHGSRLHFIDYSTNPEHYMAAADVFCLPSYREGFGTVIIEAAAVGIPTIASRVYGITDAVEHEVTGLLHTAGDIEEITRLMKRLCEDAGLRSKLGASACRRARRDFSSKLVTSSVITFYRQLTYPA